MSCYSNILLLKYVAIAAVAVMASCLPRTLLGQGTFVIPQGFESKEGDSSYTVGGRSQHFQVLADAAAFPVLGPSGVLLTGVSFRPNTLPPNFGGGDKVFDSLQVIVSSQRITGGSHVFYQPGSDATLVFLSSVSWSIPFPAPPGPAGFSIRIPFDRPFVYNSGAALLLDITLQPRGPTDGWVGDWAPSSLMTTLGLDAFGNLVADPSGPVLQFAFQAVPEPVPFDLLAGGSLIATIWRRIGRRLACH